jgi:hypothetical protein
MALIYGQLESAQLENKTVDYSATVTGRVWYRSDTGAAKIANGSAVRQFLINDGNIVIGNNGTAANNVRLHRGANAVLQFVVGSDSTAEGSLSTSLAQFSSRIENYTDAGKPTFGNAGRMIWTTDLSKVQIDTGAAWTDVSLGIRTALSLFGVAGNSNAAGADIVASSDKTLPRRSGTSIAFGKITQEYRDYSVVTKTSGYTSTEQDHIIRVDGSSSAFAITLHTPTYNQELIIVRVDSTPANAVSLTGTISGETDWKLHTKNESYTLRYSTTLSAWVLIDHSTSAAWDAGTITFSSTGGSVSKGGTPTRDSIFVSRRGKFAVLTYRYSQTSAGSMSAGDILIDLPSGIVADLTYSPLHTGALSHAEISKAFPTKGYIGTSSNGFVNYAFPYSTSKFRLSVEAKYSTGHATWSNSLHGFGSNPLHTYFEIEVPVDGWKP